MPQALPLYAFGALFGKPGRVAGAHGAPLRCLDADATHRPRSYYRALTAP